MKIPIALCLALVAGAFFACRDAEHPGGAGGDGGEPGSTTPPGDYQSTGHGGLGIPVNEVGADAGLPPIDTTKK